MAQDDGDSQLVTLRQVRHMMLSRSLFTCNALLERPSNVAAALHLQFQELRMENGGGSKVFVTVRQPWPSPIDTCVAS